MYYWDVNGIELYELSHLTHDTVMHTFCISWHEELLKQKCSVNRFGDLMEQESLFKAGFKDDYPVPESI